MGAYSETARRASLPFDWDKLGKDPLYAARMGAGIGVEDFELAGRQITAGEAQRVLREIDVAGHGQAGRLCPDEPFADR